MIKLRSSSWGGDPGSNGWTLNVSPMVFLRGRQGNQSRGTCDPGNRRKREMPHCWP